MNNIAFTIGISIILLGLIYSTRWWPVKKPPMATKYTDMRE